MTVLGAVTNCFLTSYPELSGCWFLFCSARIWRYLQIIEKYYVPSAFFFLNRENNLTSLISPLKSSSVSNLLKHSSFSESFEPVHTGHTMEKLNWDGIFQPRLRGLLSVISLVLSFYILVQFA